MEKVCSVGACDRVVVARGWCSGHYDRWRRRGDVQADRPLPERRPRGTCRCGRPAYARGWCEAHYRRHLRGGDAADDVPVRAAEDPPAALRTCSVEGCSHKIEARGWCHGHYLRWHRVGDVRADVPLEPRVRRSCTVETCPNRADRDGYCQVHFKRRQQHGDPRPEVPIRPSAPHGTGKLSHGYRVVPVPRNQRWLTGGTSPVMQHRLVMAGHLGRPLTAEENVHHRNGDRLDNRIENLELWGTTQPKGQRVTDKIEWAVQVLQQYGPGLLRGDSGKRPVSDIVVPTGFEPAPLP